MAQYLVIFQGYLVDDQLEWKNLKISYQNE